MSQDHPYNASYLLNENGSDRFLLEDSSGLIILDTAPPTFPTNYQSVKAISNNPGTISVTEHLR
jgi:hypothetical protein